MTPDVPEFHTQPSTPISPIPYHPPAPSKLPVLEKQIDPIFNMTSTHTGPGADEAPASYSNSDHKGSDDSGSSTDANSFSDPFEDQDDPEGQSVPVTSIQTTGDADDDYAMTFESEGEGDTGDTPPQDGVASTVFPSSTTQGPVSVVSDETPPPIIMTPAQQVRNISAPQSEPRPMETTAAPPIARADAPAQGYKPSTPPPIYQSIQNGEIDIQQLLDNITANAELEAAKTAPTSASTSSSTIPPGSSAFSHTSLPPRPQVLSQPPMHPAYAAQNDIRMYHAGPTYPAPPGTASRAPGMPGSLVAAGAPGTQTDPRSGLPPPPAASFNSPPASFSRPGETMPFLPQRGPQHSRGPSSVGDVEDEGEIQWGPDMQKSYEAFLAEERRNVAEGVWDKYPMGSRLFIGNLVSEKVTKRDLFYIFHKYGRLAQLSIKQAFGFVQYHDVASCSAALYSEQGQPLRGRRMHLEISKQQKNAKHANANQSQQNQQRRSKSPDRSRGGNQRGQNNRNQQQPQNNNYDRSDNRNDSRFDNRGPPQQREQDYRQGPPRGRDDYRPMRSPSPPRGGYRGRDDYTPQRGGRDYYDGPNNRRTRSRSPDYSRRQPERYRQRSPSPRRPIDEDAALGIPRRAPTDVPDVQILLMEELDRNFISWVESEIRKRGLKTEVMFLSPRLPVEIVVKRQILEGVMAVVKLTRRTQDASKIPLQVFDRSRGADNVRYDDYENLDPSIAAEVVLREKAKVAAALQPQQPPQQPAYGQPPMQYGAQPQYQQPLQAQATAPAPNLGNVVAQLDNATLQKLLGTLSAPLPQQAPAPAPFPQQQSILAPANGQVDINSILSMLGQVQQQPQQQAQHQPPQYAPQPQQPQPQPQQNPNQQYAAQQPQGGLQDVQNIMAQLARFRQ